MKTYRLADLALSSNRLLPELAEATAPSPDWTFVAYPAGRLAARRVGWFHRWRLPDDRPWLSFARDRGGYLLRFHGLADFRVDTVRRRISCRPGTGVAPVTVRHLLLDQVMPLVLGTRRRLALHASAVCSPQGVLGFLGPTGAGKSTLAAALGRSGWAVLSDDCLVVDAAGGYARAIPSYPGVRLRTDSMEELYGGPPRCLAAVAHYTDKQRVGPESGGFRFCEESLPLARLYVLAPAGRARGRGRLFTLSRRQAMVELLRFTYHLDVTDAAALAARFRLAGRIAGQVAMRALCLPSRLGGLGGVRRLLENDLMP